jgi:hypothetical protein
MSMLVFYINRAGRNLSKTERARLEKAKEELRKAFGSNSPNCSLVLYCAILQPMLVKQKGEEQHG